ncbi:MULTISPECIES: STELLO glycosyltransferase family protein [Spirulina sp. CCY15215]|uniref:STELLO glycosyltransferase family protein n=1 Tax=Spirulina sp. CCY15215 TaxID=2767591 RepID=UPI00194DBBA4|nr:STELLO glycosyltransferase family protein [Spirulina major]
MDSKVALVVTSIAQPNIALKKLSQCVQDRNWSFIIIGDVASPADFYLEGCDFYNLSHQLALNLKFAQSCPERHYARKNIGYLLALQNNAEIIIETDDDNIPYQNFENPRQRQQTAPVISESHWINVYRYFTEANIWPRGLPLDTINKPLPDTWENLEIALVDCPIQQGLADRNPDVDAIYRLTLPLPQDFRRDRRLALSRNSWCPFNSQNTTWWRDTFPLLYLPAYCSFRMTDIWRSFVAQRIAWENNWHILFHEPTVWQERNEHNLMHDFEQEVVGYLHNYRLCEALQELNLQSGQDKLADNMRICYEKLVSLSILDRKELELLNIWLEDINFLTK